MDASLIGMAVAQTERPAQERRPASYDITFVDTVNGGDVVKVNSPVPVDPSKLNTVFQWLFSGFSARVIPWKNSSFLVLSCRGLSGSVVKS